MTDMILWPKFGNSSIFIREVIITSIVLGFDHKNQFFEGILLVQVQKFGTDTSFEILHQCGKKAKPKSQKALGANS